MFSIMLSTGYVEPKKKSLVCFSALGGQTLGQLVVRSESADMYATLRDLQLQASKLMPSTTRSFEDIVLRCLGSNVTPSGFAYKQQMTQDEVERASIILSASRVDILWDNDEFVRLIMRENKMYFQHNEQENKLSIECTGDGVITTQVAGFLRNSRVCELEFSNLVHYYDRILTDRAGSTVPNVQTLRLSGVWLDTFRVFNNIVHLTIRCASMPSSFVHLDKLRVLVLQNVSYNVPGDFGDLRINELCIYGNYRMDVIQFAPHFAKLTCLTKLELCNNTWYGMPPRSFPSEIGRLTSLKRLIVENNKFTGSVPSEIGTFIGLSTLSISWFEEEGHLEVPQQVRDLQIANKRIVQY